jgi:hypothetical protein
VPELSAFEFELAIEKLKSLNHQVLNNSQRELFKTGRGRGRTISYEIHKIIISNSNKEVLPEGFKESIIELICKKSDKT